MERIEPQVMAFAKAGRRRWRTTRTVDERLFGDVPAVQRQLQVLDAAHGDPNAMRDAIETAIEAAIQSLPDPERAVALNHFGFTDTGEKPLGETARDELAAQRLGKQSGRWYRGPVPEFHGLTGREYTVALVTCALVGIEDPLGYVKTRAVIDPSQAATAESGNDRQPEHDAALAHENDRTGDQSASTPRSRRRIRWRVALLALLAASAVVAVIWASGSDHTRSPQVLTIGSLTATPDAPVAVRMRGINNTYKPHWGRVVTADATDDLSFEARIENRTSGHLHGLLFVVTCTTFCRSGSAPLALRASVVNSHGDTLGTSNRVRIQTQSYGFQRFVFGGDTGDDLSEVFNTGIGVSSSVVAVPMSQVRLQSPYDRIVKVFRIGDLPQRDARRLQFNGSWDVGASGQLSGGPSEVRIGTGRWQPRLAVSPGQIVTVGTLLDNTAYSHPWTAQVQVRFRPDRAAGTVGILTEAHLARGHDQEGPQPTGYVALHSAGTGPIDLQIVPGTTSLWGKCRPSVCVKGGDRLRLPDGLADSGIEVGPLGGFVPRDKHHGTQFTRFLVFKVRVMPLAK